MVKVMIEDGLRSEKGAVSTEKGDSEKNLKKTKKL